MDGANLMLTTDERVWAKEFVSRYGGDEELMASWFASAMCAARDAMLGPPNGDAAEYMQNRAQRRGEQPMSKPELSQHQRDLMLMGLCPFCEQQIRGWEPVTGFCAPEFWASCDDRGIDGGTGHKKSCEHKEITL